MTKPKDPDIAQTVKIIYSKGEDVLHFSSKANADAAVSAMLEDVTGSLSNAIISVEDDNGKRINFKAGNFVRTISIATGDEWL